METISVRPEANDAPAYFSRYIELVPEGDIRQVLDSQSASMFSLMDRISDAQSLHRYAPDKWSIREVAGHVNDTERVFAFRAFWFGRGFESALPSFDQNIPAAHADADALRWSSHVGEFRDVRAATLALFQHLPAQAWERRGAVERNLFTVRALAYIVAGHVFHHMAILKERYLRT